MIRASPCTSIETSVPALRLSRSRTALGMATCPFEETVVLIISTYHGRTDSVTMQRGCLAAWQNRRHSELSETVEVKTPSRPNCSVRLRQFQVQVRAPDGRLAGGTCEFPTLPYWPTAHVGVVRIAYPPRRSRFWTKI